MNFIVPEELPDDWSVMPVGQLVHERNQKVSDEDFRPLSVTINGVVPQLDHVAKTVHGHNRKLVRAGDLVINSRSDRKGASGLAELDGSVPLISIVMEPLRGHPRFLHHLLRSRPFQEEFYRRGQGIHADLWSTRYDELKRIKVPLPPLSSQEAVANFLDRETSRIDKLIDRKKRLLELLEEKRTALITRAVTKGLDPDIAMRDSGVEWLGEIPEHWAVSKVKHVARMESGHTPDRETAQYWNGGIQWLSLADSQLLKEVDVVRETTHQISEAGLANSSARLLPRNAVAFSRDATVGLCALLGHEMAVSQHFIGWVCSERIIPRYLLVVLRCMEQELERLTMGATIRTLGIPEVSSLVTPLPPRREQSQIVRQVSEAEEEISSLKNRVDQAVSLLKEYRTALISAAVTGKIDVIGHAA